jgi:hypothetical protein
VLVYLGFRFVYFLSQQLFLLYLSSEPMSWKTSAKRYVDKPFKVAGRLWLEFTPADVGNMSRYSYAVNPIQFGTTKVLDDLAHNFVWFRFTKLRVLILPLGANDGPVAVGYVPYPPVTLPASMEELVESGEACVCFNGQAVPAEMELNKDSLDQNQPRWFRVEPTGDDYLEYQGELTYGDHLQAIANQHILLEYEIEFLTLADDGLTPSNSGRPGRIHTPSLLKVPKGHWVRDGARGRRALAASRPPPIVRSSQDMNAATGAASFVPVAAARGANRR